MGNDGYPKGKDKSSYGSEFSEEHAVLALPAPKAETGRSQGATQKTAGSNLMEETATELAIPTPIAPQNNNQTERRGTRGAESKSGYGMLALILSILSLFFLPVLLGAAGIILGFIARGKGAKSLGNWAIGVGIISVAIGTFILPFF